jgi:putative membrane protein
VTHHESGVGVELIATELLVAALLVAAVAYLLAASGWPTGRTVRWVLGIVAAVAGIVGPVLSGVEHELRWHVGGHLLVGMVAPLLLVSAVPVTLALRRLPRHRARALARLLRSRPVAVLTHPAVAAVVDVGGLWLLFRTDLLAGIPTALVHLHMLLAGYLFAFSLVGRDPAPHRPSLAVRAGVLVAAVAAHDVLAKLMYATPLPGSPAEQAEFAGQLMYYGAAPVHVVLFVLLGREWYVAQGRQRSRMALIRAAAAARASASRPGRVAALQTASSAASVVEKVSQSPGAAARIRAGEGRPSTPPSTTPASRASSMPAAMSQSLVPASTAQSRRPHAR